MDKKEEVVNDKSDKIINLILFFFIISFLGWCMEILWCFIIDGVIANRGTLNGPWVPIYGYGCTFVMILLYDRKIMKKSKIATFFIAMISFTVIEYITSCYLEQMYDLRWWDYSGYKFNFKGRICLEMSLLFGIGGMICLYVIAPKVEKWLLKFPKKYRKRLAIILLCIFIADNIYCVFSPHVGDQLVIDMNNIK